MSVTPTVELVGVSRTFGGDTPVEALKPTDLSIFPGEYLALLGPSGSGKSTLLHLLGLLDSPSAGQYFLDGIESNTLSEHRLSGLRGQKIGFVFQSFHLLSNRTATENVELAELYTGIPRYKRRTRAEAALKSVGLGHRLQARPTTLSGGERQRVAIARALVGDPSILLADEPTGNLDSGTSRVILELLDDLHRRGTTIVLITHDEDVALRATRQARLLDGILT